MLITEGITGKAYPTSKQIHEFYQNFGNVRFVWNQLLSKLNLQYKARKQYCKRHDINMHKKDYSKLIPASLRFPHKYWTSKFMTRMKSSRKWLYRTDSAALQTSIYTLWTTFCHMFRGLCEAPNFKSRKCHRQTYTDSSIPKQKQYSRRYVKLSKIGYVKVHLNKPIIGNIKRITVILMPTGYFKISLITEYENQVSLKKTGRWVGIDVGLDHLLNLSTGQKYDFKYFDKPLQNKRRYWQIRTNRRRKQAIKVIQQAKHEQKQHPNTHVPKLFEFHNYVKARHNAAKINHKIVNQTNDYLQKLTTSLVRRFDIICIEDLPVSKMLHNHSLARAESRACWRRFRIMLTYKCRWYGKALICVDKDYTSQYCSHCHTWCGKKDLGTRSFYCKNKKCPYHYQKLDRDINAAKNILQLGLRQIAPKTLQPISTVA